MHALIRLTYIIYVRFSTSGVLPAQSEFTCFFPSSAACLAYLMVEGEKKRHSGMCGRDGRPEFMAAEERRVAWKERAVAEGGLVPEGEFRTQAVRIRCQTTGATHILQLGKIDSHAHEAENEGRQHGDLFVAPLIVAPASSHSSKIQPHGNPPPRTACRRAGWVRNSAPWRKTHIGLLNCYNRHYPGNCWTALSEPGANA